MNVTEILAGLNRIAPEAALTGLILLVILCDVVCRRSKFPVALLALVGLIGVASLAVTRFLGSSDHGVVFLGSATSDLYSLFFRGLFLTSGALLVLFAIPGVSRWATGQGEFYTLLLSCTLGMCFMAMASDMLMMYLALEFVSITSYIMAGLLPRNRRSAEASLKYIIYGAAASGLMIYGMSLLYGMTGSLGVDEVGRSLAQSAAAGTGLRPTMALVISVLVMAGFGYKIAAVPFHMWCPDVYEGAPTPVTAFFSIGPKAAGFAMLARFVHGVFASHEGGPSALEWRAILGALAIVTVVVGNLAALQQQNLKRLMAYSSIAHAGYLLLAFAAFTADNVSSVLFYTFAYVIMNLGAFLVVIVLEEKYGIETVDGCRGLGWRSPSLGVIMTVFLVSLTGLPPTVGFIGKLMIFGYLVKVGGTMNYALAVIAVIFSVVSLYYYARIVAAMFLAKPREGATETPWFAPVQSGVLWVLAAATLILGVAPGRVVEYADTAARSLMR